MGVSTDDDGQLLILMPAHNVVACLLGMEENSV
jgi:hypothetical protein